MNLTISIAQIDVSTSQPEMNLKKGEVLIDEAARRGSDLICFPEMWTTGFNWKENSRLVKEHKKIINRIASMAKQYRIWINGSVLAQNRKGNITNTSLLFSSTGEQVGVYHKTHLFSMFHEEKHVDAGHTITVADTPWGRIGLAICYDLRFPELFRSYALQDVHLVLLPSAFPYPRREHWQVLLRARAIENQFFMIGVNQVGSENVGRHGAVTFFGSSAIIDPWGKTVIQAGEQEEMLLTATINTDQIRQIRAQMNVFADRRPDIYEL